MLDNKKLGKGLGALIGDTSNKEFIREIEVEKIVPNPLQPRKVFDKEKIEELASSIKQNGILQPILVRQVGDHFEIIAGERRFKAAILSGFAKVPVILKKVEEEESLELAIIENIQRENLNSIEEGEAYKVLLEKYDYTQEELAHKLGKNRVTITNTLRLLKLPEIIKDDISSGKISSGHARALLAVESQTEQLRLAEKVMVENLSVREIEKIVKETKEVKETKKSIRIEKKKVEIIEMETKLREFLGTKVKISDGNNKGKIEIEYYSVGDLDRILETIGANK